MTDYIYTCCVYLGYVYTARRIYIGEDLLPEHDKSRAQESRCPLNTTVTH